MEINVNGIKITLTKQQLDEIARQTAKYKIEDINDLNYAEKVLEETNFHVKYTENQFCRAKDWLQYQLETIIKAANYIDNDNKQYIPDFNNSNTSKYIAWLEKKSSGWVVGSVTVYYCCSSDCPLWLYFKNDKTAKLIATKHLDLYSKVWG